MIEPGIYRHYKGQHYKVTGTALHSETLEELVVYMPLYENKLSALWVRPAKMFEEIIEVNGKKVKRFEKVDAAPD
jgi:hypothetical protein